MAVKKKIKPATSIRQKLFLFKQFLTKIVFLHHSSKQTSPNQMQFYQIISRLVKNFQ
jgi:hypothetical protein